jgi:hypothetical protein
MPQFVPTETECRSGCKSSVMGQAGNVLLTPGYGTFSCRLGVPDVESVSWQMIFQLCSASRIRLNSHGRIGTLPSSEVLAQRLLPAAR